MFDKLTAGLNGFRRKASAKCMEGSSFLFSKSGMNGMQDVLNDEFADERAQGGASSATNLVVGLVVAGLMAAFLLPIAIDEISNVTTTSWSDGASSLWSVLPIMIVLAIFLFFVGLALDAK